MSHLHKFKRHDIQDMFNNTSRYLDDIFIIDDPDFEKHIPDIYPTEFKLNKANTSDKEPSFLAWNIEVIGSDVHTSVYDKRDDFGLPIVKFPGLSGDFPWLPSYGISQLIRFARCCTKVLDFHSKIFKSLQNYWHRIADITNFEKHLECSPGHTLAFCQNLVKYRFKNMLPKESFT